MSNLNQGRIDPVIAREKSQRMRDIALEIEAILKEKAKIKMEEIDDDDANVYFNGNGASKPSELRATLDAEIAQFDKFHEQIKRFAANVDSVASTMENQ